MPEFKIGTCRCCGRGPRMTTLAIGYLDGEVYVAWVCMDCMHALREMRKEREASGGSGSQERNP